MHVVGCVEVEQECTWWGCVEVEQECTWWGVLRWCRSARGGGV